MKALIVPLFILPFALSHDPCFALPIDQSYVTKIEKNSHEKPDLIDFHLKYPRVNNVSLKDSAKNFNMMVDDLVETQTGNFRALVTEAHTDTNMKQEPFNIPSSFNMGYEILLDTGKSEPLLSILFTIDTMITGSAHPNLTHRVINYDFKKGEVIAIAELFKSKPDFIPTLNRYLSAKLMPIMHKTEKEMVENNEINYSQWNITEDGILVTLDEFPHVYGLQQVLVPYATIKSLLNPHSPIARCLGSDMKLKCE